MSRPTRARGLKQTNVYYLLDRDVAPYAGAWIETDVEVGDEYTIEVAPYAGAWIETTANQSWTNFISAAPYAGACPEAVRKGSGLDF